MFSLDGDEIEALYEYAAIKPEAPAEGTEGGEGKSPAEVTLPREARVSLTKAYGYRTGFRVRGFDDGILDEDKAAEWTQEHTPKFVYIRDYEMSGAQIELDQLK